MRLTDLKFFLLLRAEVVQPVKVGSSPARVGSSPAQWVYKTGIFGAWDCKEWSPPLQGGKADGFDSHKLHQRGKIEWSNGCRSIRVR